MSTTAGPPTRPSFLQRLRDVTDRDAIGEFYARYEAFLRSLFRRAKANEPDDAAVGLVLRLFLYFRDKQTCPERGFRRYLWRCVQNDVRNALRRAGRGTDGRGAGGPDSDRLHETYDFDSNPALTCERNELVRLVQDILKSCPLAVDQTAVGAREWAVFWRIEKEGATANQVAAEMGLPLALVQQDRVRGKRKLRTIITGILGEDYLADILGREPRND